MGIRRRVALLTWAGLMAALPASAGAYESPLGYSIEFPESWRTVDPATLGVQSPDDAEKELAGKLAERVDLALVGPEMADFRPNVIVVVAQGRLEVGPNTVEEEAQGLKETLASAGGGLTILDAALTSFGEYEGIRLEGELQFGAGRPPVRNLIAIVPGSEYTYTITCTASPESYAELEPQFQEILTGLSIETSIETAPDQPPPIVWTLLALVVAVLLIVSWLRMQRASKN